MNLTDEQLTRLKADLNTTLSDLYMTRKRSLDAVDKVKDALSVLSDTSAPPRFPGDPGKGKILWGESHNDNLPRNLPMGLHRSYWQWTDVANGNALASALLDISLGRLPVQSFKQPGSWADMAAGKHDDWLAMRQSQNQQLPAIFVGDHHEPWDDRNGGPSGTNCGTQQDFVAMNVHAMKFKAKNESHFINLQSFPFSPSSMPPGDPNAGLAWFTDGTNMGCDIATYNAYNHKSFNPNNGLKWRSVEQVFDAFPTLATLGLPIGVLEWGVRTDPANPGLAGQWIKDAFEFFIANNFVVASYFDSSLNVNDGGSPWTLDDQGNERLDAFAAVCNDIRTAHLTA